MLCRPTPLCRASSRGRCRRRRPAPVWVPPPPPLPPALQMVLCPVPRRCLSCRRCRRGTVSPRRRSRRCPRRPRPPRSSRPIDLDGGVPAAARGVVVAAGPVSTTGRRRLSPVVVPPAVAPRVRTVSARTACDVMSSRAGDLGAVAVSPPPPMAPYIVMPTVVTPAGMWKWRWSPSDSFVVPSGWRRSTDGVARDRAAGRHRCGGQLVGRADDVLGRRPTARRRWRWARRPARPAPPPPRGTARRPRRPAGRALQRAHGAPGRGARGAAPCRISRHVPADP